MGVVQSEFILCDLENLKAISDNLNNKDLSSKIIVNTFDKPSDQWIK